MATLTKQSFKEYLANTAVVKMFNDIREGFGTIFGNEDIENDEESLDKALNDLGDSKITEALNFQIQSLDKRANELESIQNSGDLPNKLKEQNIEAVEISDVKIEKQEKAKIKQDREKLIGE